MKLVVMAIKDRAADAFGQPFYTATVNQGIRGFQDAINRNSEDNMMLKHPEDFDLYHLGEYDDSNGTFANLPDGPNQVAIGKHLKQQ